MAIYNISPCRLLSPVQEPALFMENASEHQLHTGRGARTLIEFNVAEALFTGNRTEVYCYKKESKDLYIQ